jgi:hypothetical protein
MIFMVNVLNEAAILTLLLESVTYCGLRNNPEYETRFISKSQELNPRWRRHGEAEQATQISEAEASKESAVERRLSQKSRQDVASGTSSEVHVP